MIVKSTRSFGIGPFIGAPLDLDLSGIPGGSVIAVMGNNGAGKSHVLSFLAPGPLFQELPHDRDPTARLGRSLASHVRKRHRDAYVETSYLVGGHDITIHLDINGKTKKTEGYITVDGERHGPLLTQIRPVIAKYFGSRGLFMIGPFACQGGYDAFSRIQQAHRRTAFCEMLGIGHYEVLHTRTKACEEATLAELAELREALETTLGRSELRAHRREALAAAVVAIDAAAAAVIAARADHDAAVTTHQAAREAFVRCEATHAERTRLDGELATLAGRVTTSAERLAALETTLIESEAIRAAVARLVTLDADLVDARAAERDASERLPTLESAVATATAERDRLAQEYRRNEADRVEAAAAAARVATVAGLTTQRTELEHTRDGIVGELAAHDARTPEVADDVAIAATALTTLDGKTTDLETAAHTEAAALARRRELESRKAELLRRNTMLGSIPNVDECATCPLTTDIRDAMATLAPIDAELETLPVIDGTPAADALTAHRRDRLAAERARDRAQAAERQHAAARTVLEQRRRTADTEIGQLAEQIAAAAADRELASREATATAAVEDTRTKGIAAKTTLEQAVTNRDTARTTLDARRTRVSTLETGRTTAATLAARLPDLATAEAQHDAESKALASTQASQKEVQAALDALPPATLAEAEAAVATAVQRRDECAAAITDAEGKHQAAIRNQAGLDAEVQALGDPEAEVAILREREAALVRRAADLAVLKRPLSPNGIPALIIDAAGPVISARANHYIATAYTPQFQIALTTTRPLANGKGVEEVFDYRLLDAEVDREEDSRGSGGEMSLIDTALRLSIIVENVQRSGYDFKTLFLDEPTGALSQENAPKYVDMVRLAMREGHFHHAFIVTHTPEVWEQADARIIVDKDERTARLFIPGATPASPAQPAQVAAA
jgi:DNA repair exonuclease SbcCD ATPase subunit